MGFWKNETNIPNSSEKIFLKNIAHLSYVRKRISSEKKAHFLEKQIVAEKPFYAINDLGWVKKYPKNFEMF